MLPGLAAAWPPLRVALGVEDRTASGRGYALTFDDGPHPQGTPAVLDVLAREQARATFFLVGEQVRRDPALAGEILAAGHTIALHCDRHRNLLRVPPRQVREDIARAEDAIAAATGIAPALYRPPYGVLNAAALRLARRRGWRTLLWSHWGRDWEAARDRLLDRRAPHRRRRRGLGAAAPRRRSLLRAGLLASHRRRAAGGHRHDARARARGRSRLTAPRRPRLAAGARAPGAGRPAPAAPPGAPVRQGLTSDHGARIEGLSTAVSSFDSKLDAVPQGGGARVRTRWWREALLIAWLAWVYDAINNLAPLRLGPALSHGREILSAEGSLGIAPERSLDQWLSSHHGLGLVVSDYYDNAHFVVTVAVLALLWWQGAALYRPLRNTLIAINLLAFVVFWLYPVAPPRMLGGFTDVVATTHAIGSWHTGALASHANQLAAMPSLHIAWAVWVRGRGLAAQPPDAPARGRGALSVRDRLRRARDREPLPARHRRRNGPRRIGDGVRLGGAARRGPRALAAARRYRERLRAGAGGAPGGPWRLSQSCYEVQLRIKWAPPPQTVEGQSHGPPA